LLDPSGLRFVLASLPPPPARVLEVGAGEGELTRALGRAGYEVVAIDPAASGAGPVRPVALHATDEPPASFEAAVAVVAMHHVRPLAESCARLADLVSPGGRLVLDEFDVARVDERAAVWSLAHLEGHEHRQPAEVIAELRHHCHTLDELVAALEPWFQLSEPTRGPYLYRWARTPELRAQEERLIAAGELPATGARVLGTRR
jgi:SAM-dependent methyltransferase